MRYFARKTPCQNGHTHASAKEAKRCNHLHDLQRAGKISGLQIEPVVTFTIDGRLLKMANHQAMKFTPDFSYIENGKKIVEDVKAANGHLCRDVPIKLALARHLWPEVDWRLVT